MRSRVTPVSPNEVRGQGIVTVRCSAPSLRSGRLCIAHPPSPIPHRSTFLQSIHSTFAPAIHSTTCRYRIRSGADRDAVSPLRLSVTTISMRYEPAFSRETSTSRWSSEIPEATGDVNRTCSAGVESSRSS